MSGRRWPAAGRPCRVAFVGQRHYFEACSLTSPAGGLEPLFVDFRAGEDTGALISSLEDFAPHVVIVFRPEIVPAGLFADLPAATVGYNTEPLPRGRRPAHPDLAFRLSELQLTDPGNFDRLITFDPLSAEAASRVAPVWRSMPLPVDDQFFAPVRRGRFPPRVLFAGYSTEYRERFLIDVKHEHDVLHLIHGVHGERLRKVYARVDIAINLHNHPYPTYENRVSMHLAAGHLVVSEPLSPAHALEPGIDFLEIETPWQLKAVIAAARADPDGHWRMRVRGRLKAEGFRASRIYPRLIADLRRDLAAFGTGRG